MSPHRFTSSFDNNCSGINVIGHYYLWFADLIRASVLSKSIVTYPPPPGTPPESNIQVYVVISCHTCASRFFTALLQGGRGLFCFLCCCSVQVQHDVVDGVLCDAGGHGLVRFCFCCCGDLL